MSTPNLDSRYAKLSDVTAAISAQAATDAGQYAQKSRTGSRASGQDEIWVNVLDHGALGNGAILWSGTSITSGSQIITNLTANFSNNDIGKVVWIDGAGSSGIGLKAVIAAVSSSTQITLSGAASTTVTNARMTYGTDDTVAIQSALSFAVSGAASGITRSVFIPAGVYVTTTAIVHRSGITVKGAGLEKTFIANVSGTPSVARATCWMLGTYGPGNGASSAKNETGYTINDAALGTSTLTFTTAASSSNYNINDIVSIEGGTLNSNTLNTPNQMGRIVAVGTGTITLDIPLADDFITGTAMPTVRKLNTGTLGSVMTSASGFSSDTAEVTTRSYLSGLSLLALVPGYSAINLSAYRSVVEDCYIEGWECLTGNPVAHCNFDRIRGQYNHGAAEWAYLTHDTTLENSTFTRWGTDPTPAAGIGIWLNSTEGARRCFFRNVNITDTSSQTGFVHYTVELYTGSTWEGGSIHSDKGVGALYLGGQNTTVRGATITKSGSDSITVGGTNCTVKESRILNTPTGSNAVYVTASATYTVAADNKLGGTAKTAADSIRDSGKWTQRYGNRSVYQLPGGSILNPVVQSGTNETTILQVSFPAGTMQHRHGYRVRAFFAPSTNTNGTKTIRVKMNNTSLFAVSVAQNAVTGHYVLEGYVVATVPASSDRLHYSFKSTASDGTTTNYVGTVLGTTLANVTDFELTTQMSSSSDAMTTYFVEFTPYEELAGSFS